MLILTNLAKIIFRVTVGARFWCKIFASFNASLKASLKAPLKASLPYYENGSFPLQQIQSQKTCSCEPFFECSFKQRSIQRSIQRSKNLTPESGPCFFHRTKLLLLGIFKSCVSLTRNTSIGMPRCQKKMKFEDKKMIRMFLMIACTILNLVLFIALPLLQLNLTSYNNSIVLLAAVWYRKMNLLRT